MKVILFDADGVVLKKRDEYFSERFAREYDAPIAEVREFFKHDFKLCQQGKLDLKVELNKHLPAWGWPKSTDDYLDYWFSADIEVDEDVLAIVKKYKDAGVKCYLTTDQEKYRAERLQAILKSTFDDMWFSCDIGFSKDRPEFFIEVLKRMGEQYQTHDVVYWDDDKLNVDVAASLGIDAHFFTSIDDLGRGLK